MNAPQVPDRLPGYVDAATHLDQLLAAGLEKIPASPARAEALRRVLRRQAIDLALRGAPSGPLNGPSPFVEAELTHLSALSARGKLPASERAVLAELRALLVDYEAICRQAGWLVRRDDQLCFHDPTLPCFLVGLEIARGGELAAGLRKYIATERGWGPAAFAAVDAGDPLEHWIDLLRSEEDPLALIERLILTCHALGAARPDPSRASALVDVLHLGISLLTWLAPPQGGEAPSPLYLIPREWIRCMVRLGWASRWVLDGNELRFEPPLWEDPPAPLGAILRALQLPRRLTEDEAFAVAAVCAPFSAARQGRLKEAFFRAYFENLGRFWSQPGPVEIEVAWFEGLAIPAMWAADVGSATVLLAEPGKDRPAGFLLNTPRLRRFWLQAWESLLESDPRRAVQAWVRAVLYVPSNQEAAALVLDDAFQRLAERDLEMEAIRALRERSMQSQASFLESMLHGDKGRQAIFQRIAQRIGLSPDDIDSLAANWKWIDLPVEALRQAGATPEGLVRAVVLMLPRLPSIREEGWARLISILHDILHRGGASAVAALGEAVLALPLPSTEDPRPRGLLGDLLARLPAGHWQAQLIEWVRGHPERRAVLRGLATYSEDRLVRDQCLRALLAEEGT